MIIEILKVLLNQVYGVVSIITMILEDSSFYLYRLSKNICVI
jgi:hypothetical protein